jgi:SAM-dependent methyltransferase
MTLNAWNEYRVWSREVVRMADWKLVNIPRVLKTDAFNEAYGDETTPDFHTRPIIPYIHDLCEVSCIEIDPITVESALAKYPSMNIRQGDIRYLPYEGSSFDVVLDLSTIDHVAEYTKVLDEYWCVLVPKGLLLLVVWLDNEDRKDGEQYWFEKVSFSGELIKRFNVLSLEEFNHVHGEKTTGTLTKFVCRKKEMI